MASLTSISTTASNGVLLALDDLAKTYAYSAGLLVTTTVVYAGLTYVQTNTYTAGVLTGTSIWVKQ